VECIYSDPINAHHTTLLKRKYERLEEQTDDEHHLLELLRSASAADATRILGCLRSGDDTQSVVDFAHDLTLSRSTPSDTVLQDQSDGGTDLLVASGNAQLAATVDVLPPDARDAVTERHEQVGCISVAQIGDVSLPSFHTLL
jgi:hypothetical protein